MRSKKEIRTCTIVRTLSYPALTEPSGKLKIQFTSAIGFLLFDELTDGELKSEI